MRSIHFIENLDDSYGGPARSVPLLVEALASSGVESTIFSINLKENEFNSVLDGKEYFWKTFSYQGPAKLRYSRGLRQFSRNYVNSISGPAVIHIHNLWNYVPYIASQVAFQNSIPLVVSPRGSLFHWNLENKKYRKRLSRLLFQDDLLRKASCIHATSEEEMAATKELGFGAPIAVIPNGIDRIVFRETKETYKRRLNLDTTKRHILFYSRIHPKKGLDKLTKAWSKLGNSFPDWTLVIAGFVEDGNYLAQTLHQMAQMSRQDSYKFLGPLTGDDREAALGAGDLFVLPTHSENFGIAIAEALMAGIPVITTKGAPWSGIKTSGSGWWIENEQKHLEKALVEALSKSKRELSRMGVRGKALLTDLDWETKGINMKETYDWLCGLCEQPDFVHS